MESYTLVKVSTSFFLNIRSQYVLNDHFVMVCIYTITEYLVSGHDIKMPLLCT